MCLDCFVPRNDGMLVRWIASCLAMTIQWFPSLRACEAIQTLPVCYWIASCLAMTGMLSLWIASCLAMTGGGGGLFLIGKTHISEICAGFFQIEQDGVHAFGKCKRLVYIQPEPVAPTACPGDENRLGSCFLTVYFEID